jgi:hypothetical protein
MTARDGGVAVKVALDPFVLGSLEARFAAEPARGVEAALHHYERRLRSPVPPAEVPLFMRGVAVESETATEIQIAVTYDVYMALSREAERQEVDVDRIVAHAVFVFLHDIKADGRPGDSAKENGEASRYADHATRQPPSARRPRGMAAGARLLRRGGSTGGRSRFGRR